MRHSITLVLLAALGATPAFAQERAPRSGTERAAQIYGAAEWPLPGPIRAGVDPGTVAAAGLTRSGLRVDALSEWRAVHRLDDRSVVGGWGLCLSVRLPLVRCQLRDERGRLHAGE